MSLQETVPNDFKWICIVSDCQMIADYNLRIHPSLIDIQYQNNSNPQRMVQRAPEAPPTEPIDAENDDSWLDNSWDIPELVA
jgi:hypothetical protein